jgi:hypothetical protein
VPGPYLYRPPWATLAVTIFLSSGSDAARLRDRVDLLVRTISTQFRNAGSRLRFEVDRWEDHAPQRATTSNLNDEFVRCAKASHLTLVLLLNEVRQGTREEIEGVLSESTTQLAVLRFKETDGDELADEDLRKFLEANKGKFLYKEVLGPDSNEAWAAIMMVLAQVVASVTTERVSEEPLSEER